MCEEGLRISRALNYIHAVKYFGADCRPLVDKLFTYHTRLMFTHRKIVSATKTNYPGVYLAVEFCERCEVPWPCEELDSWLDILGGNNGTY